MSSARPKPVRPYRPISPSRMPRPRSISTRGPSVPRRCYRLTDPTGRIGHAEMRIGNSVLMLSDEHPDFGALRPADDRRLAGQVPHHRRRCRRLHGAGRGGGGDPAPPARGPVLRHALGHGRRPVRPQLVHRRAARGRRPGGDSAPLQQGARGRDRLKRADHSGRRRISTIEVKLHHRLVVLVGDRRSGCGTSRFRACCATASCRRSCRGHGACRPDRPASASAARRRPASRGRPAPRRSARRSPPSSSRRYASRSPRAARNRSWPRASSDRWKGCGSYLRANSSTSSRVTS